MKKVISDGVIYYKFNHLACISGINHAVFSRHGGVSLPPFDFLNMSIGAGDNKEHVLKNRKIAADIFGQKDIVFTKQVHKDRVMVIAKAGQDSFKFYEENDAIVTDIPFKTLAILTADCQPILLYDPVKKVIANIHCGWRGSVLNIIGKTIAVMKKVFQCEPYNIVAGIGPSMGPCCAYFVNYKNELPKAFWKYKDSKDRFNFWDISKDQLTACGVKAKNIEISGLCTCCNTDMFFSYRKEKITGRMASFIYLNDRAN